jgi:hypothetical protein
MLELVYKSKAKENISQEDINQILDTAQENNKKLGLTGCLIFHKDHFIQLLEGDEQNLRALYHSIIKDPRHNSIELIYEKNKEHRNFSDWGMAFVNLDEMESFSVKLFEDNLSTYADITPKITKGSDIFWNEVKQLINAI